MLTRLKTATAPLMIVAAALAGTGPAPASAQEPMQLAQLTGTIPLEGNVGPVCSISVVALPAASALNLTGGVTRVQVGTVTQNCNRTTGYTLTVTSANCALPDGARVARAAPATDYLEFSVEFDNPATGGSTDVTDLLDTACANQVGRTVAGVQVFAEQSQVYLNYTGSALLAAGTYQDTLTVTMTVN